MKKTLNYQQHFLVTLTIIQKTNTFFPKKAYLFNTMKLFGNELTSIGLRKVFFFHLSDVKFFNRIKHQLLKTTMIVIFFGRRWFFFRSFGMIVFSESSEGLISTTFSLVQIHFCEHLSPRFNKSAANWTFVYSR